LAEYCKENLPYFAVPRFFDFVESLPHTDTGKVRKVELRELGVSGTTYDAGSVRRNPKG
jgi:carnitine-CoA ligase